jgi:hypothetical protein
VELVFLKSGETIKVEVRRGVRLVIRVKAELDFPSVRDAIAIAVAWRIAEEGTSGIGRRGGVGKVRGGWDFAGREIRCTLGSRVVNEMNAEAEQAASDDAEYE